LKDDGYARCEVTAKGASYTCYDWSLADLYDDPATAEDAATSTKSDAAKSACETDGNFSGQGRTAKFTAGYRCPVPATGYGCAGMGLATLKTNEYSYRPLALQGGEDEQKPYCETTRHGTFTEY
jgi:hypothetical protein